MIEVKFKKWDCIVRFNKYINNGRTAIQLFDKKNNEVIAVATVNLVGEVLSDDEVAIKDYAENEGMFMLLIKEGIVSHPDRTVVSGHVKIPICKLLKRE